MTICNLYRDDRIEHMLIDAPRGVLEPVRSFTQYQSRLWDAPLKPGASGSAVAAWVHRGRHLCLATCDPDSAADLERLKQQHAHAYDSVTCVVSPIDDNDDLERQVSALQAFLSQHACDVFSIAHRVLTSARSNLPMWMRMQ